MGRTVKVKITYKCMACGHETNVPFNYTHPDRCPACLTVFYERRKEDKAPKAGE